MSEQFKWGDQSATLRSVILGAGSVVVVALVVSFFYPAAPRRPLPPVAAVPASPPLADAQNSAASEDAPASAPSQEASDSAATEEASASAPPQAASAAPESSAAAQSSPVLASTSTSAANPVGETAVAPEPLAKARPAHPVVRRVKRVVAHYARATPTATPAPAPAPEDAPPDVPDTILPPADPPLPPLSVVIGVRRAQPGVVSKNVSLSDLNLHTQEGVCKALKRIREAAAVVCPMAEGVGFGGLYERRLCVDEAISTTLENMHKAKFDLPKKGC